jgi:hypothetical protein
MFCGAVSRTFAKTIFHPFNTAKTILQTSRANEANIPRITLYALTRPTRKNVQLLSRGTGAQFILSAIQGAVTFAIVEQTRTIMDGVIKQHENPAMDASLDFAASVVSTVAASVVSVPQMVLMDNLMAGTYSSLPQAMSSLYADGGVLAFYRNWHAHLVGKVPSYVSIHPQGQVV